VPIFKKAIKGWASGKSEMSEAYYKRRERMFGRNKLKRDKPQIEYSPDTIFGNIIRYLKVFLGL
jgi:hypothetical protein